MTQRLGRYGLDTGRPWVMGILNLTPDSFSDGGLVRGIDAARDAQAVENGAHRARWEGCRCDAGLAQGLPGASTSSARTVSGTAFAVSGVARTAS